MGGNKNQTSDFLPCCFNETKFLFLHKHSYTGAQESLSLRPTHLIWLLLWVEILKCVGCVCYLELFVKKAEYKCVFTYICVLNLDTAIEKLHFYLYFYTKINTYSAQYEMG